MADQVTTSLAQAKVLVMQAMAGKAPRINAENQHWEVWDNDTQAWVDTGVEATGADGADGHSPYINSSGYWVVFDDGTQAWVTTDVKAAGVDGVSPAVTITEITRGHRVKITDAEHPQGQSFDVTNGFNGLNGANGVDGHSPYADATTGTWWVYDDASGLWVDSHVTAVGTNGKSPYINSTGYWVFWNDSTGAWVVTNYKAAGVDGEDGHSPYIGANGHWFAWDDNLAAYDDTGVAARGPQGDDYVLTNQDKQDIASQAASQVEPLVPTRIGQLQDDVGLVHYNSQTLTDAQQAQARANIGAASMSDLGTVFTLKGGVATVNDLPQTDNRIGDVWYVESVSAGFIWITSTAYPNGYWEELGETIDLSDMATKTWVSQQGYLTLSNLPIYNGGVT